MADKLIKQAVGEPISFKLIKDYCAAKDWPFYEFSRPQTVPLLVKHLDANKLDLQVYGLAHAYLAYVENVRVFGQGHLLTDDNDVFAHGLSYSNFSNGIEFSIKQTEMFTQKDNKLYQHYPAPTEVIEEEVVLLWGGNNFGHWLHQYLTRLANLYYMREFRDKKLLLKSGMPDRFLDYLTKLGFKRENFVFGDDNVYVKKLWVPSIVKYRGQYNDYKTYIWPAALHYLRDHMLGERAYFSPSQLQKPLRLYVSRASAEWRRVVDEEQLIDRLDSLGFMSLEFQDHPVAEQIDLISRAEIVIFSPGCANQMVILAPRDCDIIEFSSDKIYGVWGRIWQQMLGQRHFRIDGEKIPIADPSPEQNFPGRGYDLKMDHDAVIDLAKACINDRYHSGLTYDEGLSAKLFKKE